MTSYLYWITIGVVFFSLEYVNLSALPLSNGVELYNFKDGETINYPLVRLYGRTKDLTEGTITVTNSTTKVTNSWPVFNSDFKAYVKLVRGKNSIQFSYGQTKYSYSLFYIPPKNAPVKIVKLFYYLGQDGIGQMDAPSGVQNDLSEVIKRIKLDGLLFQSFLAESLKSSREKQQEQGPVPRMTFQLDMDSNDEPKVFIIRSTMTQSFLWENKNKIGGDVWSILSKQPNFSNTVYVGYSGISHKDPLTGIYSGGIAGGTGGTMGGGMGIIHSGNLITHANSIDQIQNAFMNIRPIEDKFIVDDSFSRHTYGGSYASTLGAFMHEGGHGFSLPHPNAGPNAASDPYGIMLMDGHQIQYFFTVYEIAEGKKVAISKVKSELGPSSKGWWHPMNVSQLERNPFLLTYTPDVNTVPSIPTGLLSTPSPYEGGAILSWDAVPGITYTLYRSGPNNHFVPVKSCQNLTIGKCKDNSALPGKTYKYQVMAINGTGKSNSKIIIVTVPLPSKYGPLNNTINFIPLPKVLMVSNDQFKITPSARIIVSSDTLLPLAELFQKDLMRFTGMSLTILQGTDNAVAGDLVLIKDSGFAENKRYFSHGLIISDQIRITGEDYASVVQGTTSFLQLISPFNSFNIPKLTLLDYSLAQYPGVMQDIARKANTLEDLKDLINLCRWYKVRYLHLHLNDFQGFTFESKILPKLGEESIGGDRPIRFSQAQWIELIQYAENRGVTIVPELETVSHAGTMIQSYPTIFGEVKGGILNLVSEEMYTNGLYPLIKEMCQIFRPSPFFHVGGDEADLSKLELAPNYDKYISDHGLKRSPWDVYRFHMQRLSKYIKDTCGKKTISWVETEGTNIIAMKWEIGYMGAYGGHGDSVAAIKRNVPVIQVTWTPSIYSSIEANFNWFPFDAETPLSPLNMGSQMVLWEMDSSVAVPMLRYKVPPRQENTYGYKAPTRTYQAFSSSLLELDKKLDLLLSGFLTIDVSFNSNLYTWLQEGGVGLGPKTSFLNSNPWIKFISLIPNATIRYTIDGTEPTISSPLIPLGDANIIRSFGPIYIPQSKDSTVVKARLFDTTGHPLGRTWSRSYSWSPIIISLVGEQATKPIDSSEEPFYFKSSATIQLESTELGGIVRYSVCAPLSNTSPVLSVGQQLVISGNSEIQFGIYFGNESTPRKIWSRKFVREYIEGDCIGMKVVDTDGINYRVFTKDECEALNGDFYSNPGLMVRCKSQFTAEEFNTYGVCLRKGGGSYTAMLGYLHEKCPKKSVYEFAGPQYQCNVIRK